MEQFGWAGSGSGPLIRLQSEVNWGKDRLKPGLDQQGLVPLRFSLVAGKSVLAAEGRRAQPLFMVGSAQGYLSALSMQLDCARVNNQRGQ